MDAIAFLTLFLGLTMGQQSIRMTATDTVKRIELRLDGAAVANMTAPPWRTSIDLGDTLTPHRLTATAFDAAGAEMGTVEQKINLPRPTTEARIVVDHDRSGTPRKAHIIWKSVATRTPRSLSADLDGAALQIADDLTIALPKLSPTPHVLRVKVVTTSGDMAEATAVIGASAAAESQSQLTAIPVELSERAAKPERNDASSQGRSAGEGRRHRCSAGGSHFRAGSVAERDRDARRSRCAKPPPSGAAAAT